MLIIHKQALAEQDLVDIWLYTFNNWGITQADLYLDQLNNSFQLAAQNPDIGKACDDIRQGYRLLHTHRHTMVYTTTKNRLTIVRVLGEEMNYQDHL